jgi:hypothetical protein
VSMTSAFLAERFLSMFPSPSTSCISSYRLTLTLNRWINWILYEVITICSFSRLLLKPYQNILLLSSP